jgi:hypothetical protein
MGKRKKRKRKSSNQIKLRKQIKADPSFKDMKILEASSQEEKMSAVILKFVEPYKKFVTSKEGFEKLIVLAMVAWNASILKGATEEQIINTLKENIPLSTDEAWSEDIDQVLTELMERKARYFANYTRLILDYSVSEARDEYNLAVVSSNAV